MESNIIYKEESYRIMGACFEVYKLGLLVNFGHYPGVEHERIVV
jgi:hypothetical protein